MSNPHSASVDFRFETLYPGGRGVCLARRHCVDDETGERALIAQGVREGPTPVAALAIWVSSISEEDLPDWQFSVWAGEPDSGIKEILMLSGEEYNLGHD